MAQYTPKTWTTGETITAAELNAIEAAAAAAAVKADADAAYDAKGAATAAQAAAVQRANHTGTQSASTVTGLSAVATSGAYTDLTGRPTIPTQYTDAQAQAANAPALASKANIADVGTAGTATGDALKAVYAPRTREFYVDSYGADPTGATDSTSAFAAALAAMPTRTVWANPGAQTGASATFPVGTLRLGAGTYKIAGQIGNLGPFVSVLGPGADSATLRYTGTGDCLRVYNTVLPSDDNFDTIAAWAGAVNGLTIDGAGSSTGAVGLHLGDTEGAVLGPDLRIANFTGGRMEPVAGLAGTPTGTGGTLTTGSYSYYVTAVNASGETGQPPDDIAAYSTTVSGTTSKVALTWTATAGSTSYRVYRGSSVGALAYLATVATNSYTDTGSATTTTVVPQRGNATGGIGLHLDNAVSWTENITGRVQLYNCDNAVVMSHTTAAAADWSMEYNDLTFKLYAFAGQQGVVLRNGVGYNNGRLVIRANMANSSTATTNACLTLFGNTGADGNGQPSGIIGSRLDVQAETNLGGAYSPQTIVLGNPYTGGNAIGQCTGVLRFFHTWTSSNWSGAGPNSPNFQFAGVISGDTNLHPSGVSGAGTAPAFAVAGSVGLSTSVGWYSGSTLNFQMQIADLFTATLTANVTVGWDKTLPGPARKTIILTQDGTGGRTVTWPKPGSPTVAAPRVLWPAGTAPTMTATANATDVYELITNDGVTWYGYARQNVS